MSKASDRNDREFLLDCQFRLMAIAKSLRGKGYQALSDEVYQTALKIGSQPTAG